jgi:hypothetical protein
MQWILLIVTVVHVSPAVFWAGSTFVLARAGGVGADRLAFMIYPTFTAHAHMAAFLVGFIVLHVLAALYHHFVRKHGLFRRVEVTARSAQTLS